MFNIKLVDIGGDGLVTDFNSLLDTLAEVEILVKNSVDIHLGITNSQLVHNDELVYSVMVNGHEAGVVAIKSL